MSQCKKLKHVDLTEFTALEVVGHLWLSDCLNLESIAFAGDVSTLKQVGNRWMYSCQKLKHVNLSGFTALEYAGNGWLCASSSLEQIILPVHVPKLKVGDSWTQQGVIAHYLLTCI